IKSLTFGEEVGYEDSPNYAYGARRVPLVPRRVGHEPRGGAGRPPGGAGALGGGRLRPRLPRGLRPGLRPPVGRLGAGIPHALPVESPLVRGAGEQVPRLTRRAADRGPHSLFRVTVRREVGPGNRAGSLGEAEELMVRCSRRRPPS